MVITAVALAVAGLVLLAMPHPPSAPAPADAATTPATSPVRSSEPAAGRHFTGSAPPASRSARATASAPSRSAPASMLPPRGEGAAGDRAIQQALESAWPTDLPAGDERQLLTAGRALLRADATGEGRNRWPAYFVRQETVAPAFSTARFRIQAAIARRDGRPDRAVVHLVWAGTDRGGTYSDGRITDLYFTRTASAKGVSAWVPQPRT
ncbi:conserved hypothetical protein [Streptomyces viridosporus ATCC 14672]|uniref:Secreted protein n=2 Tax=Streptomyces viridosporus TaxID=67581 RepID=D5ZQC7_STRV1|nr:conserved hypothetical protein [Streptomyces viridosporus ATCC 14672]